MTADLFFLNNLAWLMSTLLIIKMLTTRRPRR